ncbi:unnamed protein product [Schistosoma intercalatum]|nr:unnamed protein product [Schistosoma intercalatum]
MNHSYNHSDLLTISSITINNDSRIDSETHTITQICFSLAFCSTLIHLIFILYFKRIRKLYGFCIMIHCLFYSISYLMTLITCSLTDYCILTTIIMNLKSSLMIVYLLWNRRENMTCYHGNYQLLILVILIWLIAFLALIQASTSIWHVFTLLYSLQAIYITVNCTFTRPVLDLIYQWREEKIDYYKNEHHLLLINHILNTNQQNDTKQDRINNILINY